jgi:hypothetical protein
LNYGRRDPPDLRRNRLLVKQARLELEGHFGVVARPAVAAGHDGAHFRRKRRDPVLS